jgi:hypothetical protein
LKGDPADRSLTRTILKTPAAVGNRSPLHSFQIPDSIIWHVFGDRPCLAQEAVAMCLPRVRLTVGQLLVAVAVVAGNCGVLRLRDELIVKMERNEIQQERMRQNALIDEAPRSILSFDLLGFLALINVALIGTLLHVARRLWSFHGEIGANPRPSPVGFTYFSLHFLAIGAVVTTFMPGAIERYLETFSPLVHYAEQECWTVVSRFLGDSRWLILSCLIYGAFLSGPAILISWIGGLLTRRCAATLPRQRFLAMTCLVSLGFTAVALTVAVMPRPFAHEQDVDLDFQIVDKDSGQPIGAAFLRMTDPFNPTSIPPGAFTGADGRAKLTGCFRADGQRNAFRTMGFFHRGADGWKSARRIIKPFGSHCLTFWARIPTSIALAFGRLVSPRAGRPRVLSTILPGYTTMAAPRSEFGILRYCGTGDSPASPRIARAAIGKSTGT